MTIFLIYLKAALILITGIQLIFLIHFQLSPTITTSEKKFTQNTLYTTSKMEEKFNIAGGHWHHGDLEIDQLLMMRPFYGSAQYSTPIDGLYLCGAGTHPGGGLTVINMYIIHI